ncbi:hypothetical protein WCU37_16110 [Serratia marcescens]|uniref:hypothetical protein n=1 Tax=Serratia marcescens TaxID=615 RepID=UPI0030CB7932
MTMNPAKFIEKHIAAALVAEGFPPLVVEGGVKRGLEHFRKMSQPSKKGGAFDDCLVRARLWAQGQTPAAERKTGKKHSAKLAAQPGLF